jgi:membrane protein
VFAIYNFLTPYNDFGKKNLIFVSLLIAMLLSALKFGFDKYIVMVSKTNPIYGSLSGIFAFLAWLYLSYGIILIGGRTLFYIRNHEILKAGL